jgi:ribonuclease E
MGSKMLIDATHVEETRVVVVRGTRIEEFDFESAARKQLKGNIYLAKVTRVEPSLQAAFVDYGGNRHGFLAFSEIHPDYYQIPVADRQALIREEEEAQRRAEDEAGNGDSVEGDTLQSESAAADSPDQEPTRGFSAESGEEFTSAADETQPSSEPAQGDGQADNHDMPASDNGLSEDGEGVETVEEDAETQKVESVGAEDALEEVPRARRTQRRSYKIQEVIKRRQVILVQVVKEERGNKGAALTTYLSLAGRYCVLMPNTARGGGISRKITDANDRRRLKEVTRDIEVPEGMGLIVRTAGAQRTKTEIKRDFDYLLRLWENVRDLTLSSTAPALVYEEGNLIKRAIRDLYTKDVEEIFVEGEDAYREAKDFMKMLMPSHARNVKLYKDTRPLFSRYQVETQLDSLFSHTVTLQSGGYMVINQTEALVSIDINSGKATREHNIEDTALKTNLESSDEIARQLRLRDLAGLVVIDFIDMEEKRNNRSVERRLKDALKHDRARIQVGRISHFGLLEMSRQRLRPSLLEGSTRMCPTCDGRGMVRSVSSCALSVLRAVEEHLISKKPENLTVKTNREVASYILNDKRDHLLTLEADYQVSIFIVPNEDVKGSQAMIERAGERTVTVRKPQAAPVKLDSAFEEQEVPEAEEEQQEPAPARPAQPEGRPAEQTVSAEADPGSGRKRRRRGRRGRRSDKPEATSAQVLKEEVPGLGEQPDVVLPDAVDENNLPEQREERVVEQEDSSFLRDVEPLAPTNGSADVSRAPPGPDETSGDLAPEAVQPPSEPEREPKPTRWQPPAPTVAAQQARPKAGWWSKRQA